MYGHNGRIYILCGTDLVDLGLHDGRACCSSCHGDWDDEYGEPYELDWLSDTVLQYCCAIDPEALAKQITAGDPYDEAELRRKIQALYDARERADTLLALPAPAPSVEPESADPA